MDHRCHARQARTGLLEGTNGEVKDHSVNPEEPLLAFVLREINIWLQELASRKAEAESDKFVMMASFNMVNCIAYADVPSRRA
jgi:hypothetical protein